MLHLTTQNFDICRMNHWQFSSDTPTKAGSADTMVHFQIVDASKSTVIED